MNLKDVPTGDLLSELMQRRDAGYEHLAPWLERIRIWEHTDKEGARYRDRSWARVESKLFWFIGADIKLEFEVQEDYSATMIALYAHGWKFNAMWPKHEMEVSDNGK